LAFDCGRAMPAGGGGKLACMAFSAPTMKYSETLAQPSAPIISDIRLKLRDEFGAIRIMERCRTMSLCKSLWKFSARNISFANLEFCTTGRQFFLELTPSMEHENALRLPLERKLLQIFRVDGRIGEDFFFESN
jgi:hypothetical protein